MDDLMPKVMSDVLPIQSVGALAGGSHAHSHSCTTQSFSDSDSDAVEVPVLT